MNRYVVKAEYISRQKKMPCFVRIPVTVTDVETAKKAAIDFIMNDADRPGSTSEIKIKIEKK